MTEDTPIIKETKLVFDNVLWAGRDKGNNSTFFKEAEIIERHSYKGGREIATVRFLHSGRLSLGHFTDCMKDVSEVSKS